MLLVHQSLTLEDPLAHTQAIGEVKSAYDGPIIWAEEMTEVPWG